MQSIRFRLVTVALALCLGCLAPGAASAQRDAARAQAMSEAARAQAVMQRMHLTTAQQKKLAQIEQSVVISPEWRKATEDFQAHHNLALFAKRAGAINDRANARVLAMLNPTQRKLWSQYIQQAKQRMQAMMKQLGGHPAIAMQHR